MEQRLPIPVSPLNIEKYVGLVLVDGLSGAEKKLMDKIGDWTDVFFVGGSGGEDLKFQSTHAMCDRRPIPMQRFSPSGNKKRLRHRQHFKASSQPVKGSWLPRAQERGIVFHCQIKHGMELEILEATDIVARTTEAIETRKAAKQCDRYGEIFAGIPTAGFSTYGEAYLGHIKQTSTILVFRQVSGPLPA